MREKIFSQLFCYDDGRLLLFYGYFGRMHKKKLFREKRTRKSFEGTKRNIYISTKRKRVESEREKDENNV